MQPDEGPKEPHLIGGAGAAPDQDQRQVVAVSGACAGGR